MSTISAIGPANAVAFKGNADEKKTGGGGKAIASTLLPGLKIDSYHPFASRTLVAASGLGCRDSQYCAIIRSLRERW